jgi:hypothetical protein
MQTDKSLSRFGLAGRLLSRAMKNRQIWLAERFLSSQRAAKVNLMPAASFAESSVMASLSYLILYRSARSRQADKPQGTQL